MARYWRWGVVVAGVLLLVSLPAVIAALPAGPISVSAAVLLARIRASGGVPYSGYAEADGGLALPVTDQFSGLADLFGGQTRLRVWWRGPTNWRVDSVAATGESDVHVTGGLSWTWDYEAQSATVEDDSVPAAVRFPAAYDLVPASLGRRLLSEAARSEVSRLPAARVAGRDAAGLRLRPAERASTIDAVDVWADPATGVPLRVAVFSGGHPVLTSSFLDYSPTRPAASITAFTPPRGAQLRARTDPDVAAALDRLPGPPLPRRLATLPRNDQLPGFGAIGVYGAGVTEFAAVPLPERLAESLQTQLGRAAGVVTTPAGQAVTVGPLSLLLTSGSTGAWLLTGTVTQATLARAAAELPPTGEGA